VKNLNVSVREWEDTVIFLHRIVEGGTDRSYGIHVARLAGVPRGVLDRARQLLGELAVQHVARPKVTRRGNRSTEKNENQMPLFVDPAVELMRALAAVDLDHMTPTAAFELVRAWKAKYGR
jgi:DNA mismatch repair protein MutS